MKLSPSELLLYGGALLAAAAVLMGIVIAITWKIRAKRLDAKFEQEYGRQERK